MECKRRTEAVDQFIEDLPEDIQAITADLRKLILDSSPKLVEELKWSMPNYSYGGLVCYLQAAKKHVNLGFHKGNELQEIDAFKCLQGKGKTMRHIQIKNSDDYKTEFFTLLIQEAVALNEQ
ncbi:DUF1801 domain-containing protein [Oceanobacillus sp. CF4.6]|uniref:DUF1801 domain-containing protein n=1 Tax=Oceanobacillus sp. CF4.6 TaxID=3373080 RepID=UPI003EE625BD